ncbi:hypothetical protein TNCV_1543101 [Trichonephila clavipes]|nr:hypothetical protein TNCV_1543101 [Trichonephila clavipes]
MKTCSDLTLAREKLLQLEDWCGNPAPAVPISRVAFRGALVGSLTSKAAKKNALNAKARKRRVSFISTGVQSLERKMKTNSAKLPALEKRAPSGPVADSRSRYSSQRRNVAFTAPSSQQGACFT